MLNEGHIDDERKMIIEELPIDGYELPIDKNHTCPGHVYEAAWFVLCEAEYRDDDQIRALGKKLIDYAMPEGFLDIEKLIPTFVRPDKPYDFNTSKTTISWPQQEAIVAYRVAYSIFGDEKYKTLSEIIEKEAFAYFADREQKRWYINIDRGLPPISERTDRSGHIEGPFHLERMLLGLAILQEDGNILRYIR